MNTRLLLLSATHGDEYEVIECVQEYVKHNTYRLGDFLYIPEVSPTAVQRRTRKNKYGHDVNREFFDPPRDPEVQTLMATLIPLQFDVCINFHEDGDRTRSFYMYDNGVLSRDQIKTYRRTILAAGANLYSGIDDEKDQDLNLRIVEGYISTPFDKPKISGFSERWLVERGIAKRIFVPEIPGKASLDLKRKLVDAIFSFCLPFLPQS